MSSLGLRRSKAPAREAASRAPRGARSIYRRRPPTPGENTPRRQIMTYGHGLMENKVAIIRRLRELSGRNDPEPRNRQIVGEDGGSSGKASGTAVTREFLFNHTSTPKPIAALRLLPMFGRLRWTVHDFGGFAGEPDHLVVLGHVDQTAELIPARDASGGYS